MFNYVQLCSTIFEDYVANTEDQLRRYESQLLEAGARAATEKGSLRSQLRRIKIACQRWRVDYQRMIETRYEETVEAVEERYLSEIKSLQLELVALRQKEGETMLVLNKHASQEQQERSREILREKAEHQEKVMLERTLAKNTR